MIKLFLITIVSFRILYILYFKFKYKFWSRQPVFHTYNLWYWINPPGIIEQIIPKIDKFYDHTIITQKEDNLTLYDVICGNRAVDEVIQNIYKGLDCIPSNLL